MSQANLLFAASIAMNLALGICRGATLNLFVGFACGLILAGFVRGEMTDNERRKVRQALERCRV